MGTAASDRLIRNLIVSVFLNSNAFDPNICACQRTIYSFYNIRLLKLRWWPLTGAQLDMRSCLRTHNPRLKLLISQPSEALCVIAVSEDAPFHGKWNDGQPGIILLPYKSNCFQRIILALLYLAKANSCGFSYKQQAGIELLHFYCHSGARSSKISRRPEAFRFPVYQPGLSIKFLARFIRRHVLSVKTRKSASNIRYIPEHHASHYFSDSCFHIVFFLFSCANFASLRGQSERVLRWRSSWNDEEKRDKICFYAPCEFDSTDTSCPYLMWRLDRWQWVRWTPHVIITCSYYLQFLIWHMLDTYVISCTWFSI